MRLLLIEDSEKLQYHLGEGLRKIGYQVDIIGDGRDGLWRAQTNDYDAIILDLMLPGMDGLSILARLRKEGKEAGILILTAKETVPDRVQGLKLGADDYLTKPFAFDELTAQAGEMSAHSLKRRFPVATMPEELQPICTRLNDLLDRLQAAFERERRFSADVAHELRTPIAELRLLSELALKFPQDAASATRSFEDSLDIAKQMEMIVGTLLEMIGSDGPIPAEQLESVNVAAMAQEAWRSLAAMAETKHIQWKYTGSEAASARTNGPIVRRIFLNLLGNAVEYAPADSAIDCSCDISEQGVVVRIANAAPNLAQADLDHMAEPFWRKDPLRTGNRHSGLGLSLVSCYAQRLRIAMDFAISPQSRFTVTLKFPGTATTEARLQPD